MDELSGSLRRLQSQQDLSVEDHPKRSISRDGYGFRKSGISTPLIPASTPDGPQHLANELVPDLNGLGWPGGSSLTLQHIVLIAHCVAKSTITRLNASAEEKAAREKKMSFAIRTILECIGEDPDREGLQRTPERYAQAIMWMTRGYEERLAGELLFLFQKSNNANVFIDVINDAVFAEDHDEMVLVRDIDISSLCEHHLVPFTGKVLVHHHISSSCRG